MLVMYKLLTPMKFFLIPPLMVYQQPTFISLCNIAAILRSFVTTILNNFAPTVDTHIINILLLLGVHTLRMNRSSSYTAGSSFSSNSSQVFLLDFFLVETFIFFFVGSTCIKSLICLLNSPFFSFSFFSV